MQRRFLRAKTLPEPGAGQGNQQNIFMLSLWEGCATGMNPSRRWPLVQLASRSAHKEYARRTRNDAGFMKNQIYICFPAGIRHLFGEVIKDAVLA